MKPFIWRVVYAAVCFVLFWLVLPLFLDVIGLQSSGSLLQLMRVCTAAIAVLYVIFGPQPSMPF